MMPIVFCASLLPCECAIQAALKICNLPKTEWTAPGVKRWKSAKSANITRAPRKKPASGDVIGRIVKAVAVFENNRREDNDEKRDHREMPTTRISRQLAG